MPKPCRGSFSSQAGATFAILAAVGSVPNGWAIAENGNAMEVTRDCDEAHGGKCSLRLASDGGPGWGAVAQRLSAAEYAGRRIVLSGWLRTERAEGAAQFWLRVDAGARVVAFDNMADRPVSGTEPWTQYRLAVDVPHDASVVAFGVLLRGSGRAWADDLELAIGDEREVASTDMLRPEEMVRHLSREPAGLPRLPANLGFEQ
jgi:hypothetical protein